jgi:hypothetical protein
MSKKIIIKKVVKKLVEEIKPDAKPKPKPKPKPTTKPKPLTNKQKTYQIRGAQDKMERELLERGGRPSREWLEELRKQTFPHLYE